MQASFDGDDFILQYFFKHEHSLNKWKHVINFVQHCRTGSLSPDDDDDDPDYKTIL